MSYRIEYDSGHCKFADSSKELITQLQASGNKNISDIRKLYKSGVSDSVLEKYEKYIAK